MVDAGELARRSAALNGPVVLLVGLYLVFAASLSHAYGFQLNVSLYSANLAVFGGGAFAVAGLAGLSWGLATKRPARPFAFAATEIVRWSLPERAALAAPLFVAFAVFMSAFSSVKAAIPLIRPYALDPALARLDVLIHGAPPWLLLQPLLGHPLITTTLNIFYNLWFVAWGVTLSIVLAWTGRPMLRTQFLIGFVLCWSLLGTLGAILLSSAGPCFYRAYYPDDPFVAQMAYLRGADEVFPVWALQTQQMLMGDAAKGGATLGGGISAMPSLHVAISVLLALFARRLDWRAGGLAWAYAVVIMVSSVHLGWHYAVDGYVSVVATLMIWRLSGWIARAALTSPSAGVPWPRQATSPQPWH